MLSLTQNKALVRRLYEEVFNLGHLAAADEILDPDVVTHVPMAGSSGLSGTEGIKRFAVVVRAAFPDQELHLEDQIAEDDRVVSRWTVRGTHTGLLTLPNMAAIPASGRRFEMTEIRIDRIANARIVESWFVYDRLSWLQQLGAMPSSLDAASRPAE